MLYRIYEVSQDDLRHLREWLIKMPHIPQDFGEYTHTVCAKRRSRSMVGKPSIS